MKKEKKKPSKLWHDDESSIEKECRKNNIAQVGFFGNAFISTSLKLKSPKEYHNEILALLNWLESKVMLCPQKKITKFEIRHDGERLSIKAFMNE